MTKQNVPQTGFRTGMDATGNWIGLTRLRGTKNEWNSPSRQMLNGFGTAVTSGRENQPKNRIIEKVLTLCSTERDSNGADSREFGPNSLKLSFNIEGLRLCGGDGEIRTLGTL
jgi:hypothetical protein